MRLNKKGVTIVELLAVIVIMGIIAVIAVPTIGTLIENQRVKSAVLTGNVAIDSLRLYYLDNPTNVEVPYTTTSGTDDPLEQDIATYMNDVPNIDGATITVAPNGNITVSGTSATINGYPVTISDNKFQPLST